MEISTLIAGAAGLGFIAGVMLAWIALGHEMSDRAHTISVQGRIISDLIKQQKNKFWSDTTPSDRAMESHLAIYGLNEPPRLVAEPAEHGCTCGADGAPGEWHITWCAKYIDPQPVPAPVIFEREC